MELSSCVNGRYRYDAAMSDWYRTIRQTMLRILASLKILVVAIMHHFDDVIVTRILRGSPGKIRATGSDTQQRCCAGSLELDDMGRPVTHLVDSSGGLKRSKILLDQIQNSPIFGGSNIPCTAGKRLTNPSPPASRTRTFNFNHKNVGYFNYTTTPTWLRKWPAYPYGKEGQNQCSKTRFARTETRSSQLDPPK